MPIDVTQLDPVLQAETPQVATAPPPVPYSGKIDVTQLDPLLGGSAGAPSQTGQSNEPVPGWSEAYKNLSAHYATGMGGISQSLAGIGLATDNGKSFEDAQGEVETDALQQAQKDAEDYGNTGGFQRFAQQAGGLAAETLPSLVIGGAAMLAGAGVAAVVGAPLVVGAAAGGALVAGTLATGSMMYFAMQHGVDRDHARMAALGNGAAHAAIAYVTGGALGKGLEGAQSAALNSPTVKGAILGTVAHLAKSMGIQLGGNELDAFVDSIDRYIITRTSADNTPYTSQEATSDFMKATIQNFETVPAITLAGEGGGFATGRFFRSPQERAKALTDYLDTQGKAITQKHQQQFLANASAILKAQGQPKAKAMAITALKSQSERLALVEQAALAVRVKQGANPLRGRVEISDNPLENNERTETFLKKTIDRVAPWSRTFGQPFITHDGQLMLAFQDATNASELTKEFGISKAVEEVATLKREYSDIYYGHLTKAVGKSNYDVQKLEHAALTDRFNVDHTDANGQQATIKEITAGEAMSYVLWADNDDAKAALFEPQHKGKTGTLVGNGFSQDTIHKLSAALYDSDPDYIKALDGLKNFYNEMGPILKAEYEALNPGETLKLQWNYGGSIYRDGETEIAVPEDAIKPRIPGGEIADPRFTKKRAASKTFIKPRDAFQNAANRVRQQAQWRGTAEYAPLWHDLMNNKDFKRGIETKFGTAVYKSIKQGYVDSVSGVPAAQDAYGKWLNVVMKARSLSKLGLKPMQMAKHWMTLINFTLHEYNGKLLPSEAFTAGVLDAHLHWDAVSKRVLGWDEVKNRYAKPEEILSQLNSNSMGPLETKIQRGFMKPFEWGDKYSLIAGAHAVYKYVLKETGDPVKAKAEAVRAFKNVLASGSLDQQSAITRNRSAKAVMQFKQAETRLAQNAMDKWRTAKNFPTLDNINKAVRTHILTSIAAALFVLPETALAVITGELSGDDKLKGKEDERVFRFFQRMTLSNMLPLIDDLLTNSTTQLVNSGTKLVNGEGTNFPVYDFTIAPADAIKSVYEFQQDATKWIEGDGDLHLIYKTALDAIGSANLVGGAFPETLPKGLDWLSQIFGLE